MEIPNNQEGDRSKGVPNVNGKPSSDKSCEASNGVSPRDEQKTDETVDRINPQTPTKRVQKRGGPRTRRGKERSRMNAVRHGIFIKVLFLKGESRAEFDELLGGLRRHFQPEGSFEDLLVEKLAVILWRIRRLIEEDRKQSEAGPQSADDEAFFGRNRLSLDLLLRYESNLERAFQRTLDQLERAQRMRCGQSVLPPINLNVSEA